MLASKKVLSQYVDLQNIKDEDIAKKLTFAGIEVEDFHPLAVGSNLVIGQILTVDTVEGSDHLHLLSVNMGSKFGVSQIICGAPNVKVDAKVIVAREGAVLKDITIKKTIIHGHESNGMCCSLLELGVEQKYLKPADIEGIAILDEEAEVGNEAVLAYLDLDDTIFDIKPLANRSDVLSLYNLARELGSLFERKVHIPEFDTHVTKEASATVITKTNKCPQFAIKELYNVKVGPSPKWLANSLIALGQRSINNIVDIGNYVMLLTGQPLHMYDIDKLSSLNFSVSDQIEDDFIGLDEKTYRLEKGDLAVLIDDKPVGIAGILGGQGSAVSETTRNVAIEAANFDRAAIRVTATRLNLMSEASQRFAKGINPHQTEQVLNFAAFLLSSVCGATDQTNIINDDHVNHNQLIINVSTQYLNNLLGTEFNKDSIVATFERLNMRVTERNESLYVVIPPYRIDINSKADLAEELIRLQGFYNVNSQLPILPSKAGGRLELQTKTNFVRKMLLSRGLHETLTYTLVSEEELKLFNYINHAEPIALAHPMTPEHSHLRLHILPSLLAVAQYNYARQQANFGLFETSDVYGEGVSQLHVAAILVGDKLEQGIFGKRPYNFYDAKGIIESLLSMLDIKESRYSIEANDLALHHFHPGRSAKLIINKKLVGVFGELHPRLINERDFNKASVVGLELNLSEIFALKVSQVKMTSIPLYPSVTRDLAFVVSEDISGKSLIEEIRKVDRKLIKEVAVFDIYKGANLGEGVKSMALKLTYQDETKTLTDVDIKQVEEKIKLALDKKFNIKLRA